VKHSNEKADIFQTDYKNPNVNKTSGYLDLSILYGDVQEEQNLVRTFKDGKLKPDSFSEPRLQAFPATCSVLMVMLNRYISNTDVWEHMPNLNHC
jgi:linoleate 10R-lipoxygenase